MRRATHIAKTDIEVGPEAGTVTLLFADRHKRRIRLFDDGGIAFLLELGQATRLRHGDRLALEGGGHIRVIAAEEPVAEIRTRSAGDAARIAWHIGNRHTELQVVGERHLRILWDHVLVHMLTDHLGAEVSQAWASFEPEDGAYASGHDHDHSHDHDQEHGHSHHGADHDD